MMHEEGLPRVYARHAEMAECARSGAAALGLGPQCPSLTRHSATLTALALPAGVAPKAFRDHIKAQGILTAAGLARFEPVAFRIGHMGDLNEPGLKSDVLRAFEQGHSIAACGPSFHASMPVVPLDRIIVTEDITIAEAGVHRSPLAREASDHLPIWARLKLPG